MQGTYHFVVEMFLTLQGIVRLETIAHVVGLFAIELY